MLDVWLEVFVLVCNFCFYFLCNVFDLYIYFCVDIGLFYFFIIKFDIFVLFNIEIFNLVE